MRVVPGKVCAVPVRVRAVLVQVVLVLRTVPDLVLAGLVIPGPGPGPGLVPILVLVLVLVLGAVLGPVPVPGLVLIPGLVLVLVVSLVPGRVSVPRSRLAWCEWTRSSRPLRSGKRSSVAETRNGSVSSLIFTRQRSGQNPQLALMKARVAQQ